MTPSFLALLKRGQYHHGRVVTQSSPAADDDEATQKEYRESERFIVAAVAFCLKHDPAFLKHFFDKICRIEGDPAFDFKNVSIDIEPHHWTDLVIRNQSGGHHVYAVEFKIGAPLDDHQNPDKDAFGADNGYGKILSMREAPGVQIRYIVLGHRHSLALTKRHKEVRVISKQKQWCQVELGYESNEPITLDLFDSLGAIGIPEFNHRKTNKMNITESLDGGAAAWELLAHVHQKLGLLKNRCDFYTYTTSEKPESWEFGFSIRKKPPVQGKSRNHDRLHKLVDTKEDEIAWYGYTSDPVKKRGLSVWLYCDKKQQADELVQLLKKSFPQATTSSDKESGAPYVEVSTKGTPAKGDRNWFISVFEALGLKQA